VDGLPFAVTGVEAVAGMEWLRLLTLPLTVGNRYQSHLDGHDQTANAHPKVIGCFNEPKKAVIILAKIRSEWYRSLKCTLLRIVQ
jgi:hypothetical protein